MDVTRGSVGNFILLPHISRLEVKVPGKRGRKKKKKNSGTIFSRQEDVHSFSFSMCRIFSPMLKLGWFYIYTRIEEGGIICNHLNLLVWERNSAWYSVTEYHAEFACL